MPTRPNSEPDVADLPPSTVAKTLLLAEMAAQGVRPVDLAERLGMSKQAINRVMDLRHPTKIDAINEALTVLGKRLVISVTDL
jgi:antitoxin HicB